MRKYNIKYELDSPERTSIHREIIKKKKFLNQLYIDWYSIFAKELENMPNETIIELGSGGGFLKEIIPHVICTDVITLSSNDMTFSALEMPFKEESVGGIFLIDTMHHIPDGDLFLHEVSRVLVNRGKMILIEPANSLWGRFIYQNFHHEPFDPAGDWKIPEKGPLSGANGALPWIIFVRDNKEFKQKYPELKIESIEYVNPLLYLLSGGVSRRQLVPDCSYRTFKMVDKMLSKFWNQLSMFMIIKIIKA